MAGGGQQRRQERFTGRQLEALHRPDSLSPPPPPPSPPHVLCMESPKRLMAAAAVLAMWRSTRCRHLSGRKEPPCNRDPKGDECVLQGRGGAAPLTAVRRASIANRAASCNSEPPPSPPCRALTPTPPQPPPFLLSADPGSPPPPARGVWPALGEKLLPGGASSERAWRTRRGARRQTTPGRGKRGPGFRLGCKWHKYFCHSAILPFCHSAVPAPRNSVTCAATSNTFARTAPRMCEPFRHSARSRVASDPTSSNALRDAPRETVSNRPSLACPPFTLNS